MTSITMTPHAHGGIESNTLNSALSTLRLGGKMPVNACPPNARCA
jgi:hypothetical protein